MLTPHEPLTTTTPTGMWSWLSSDAWTSTSRQNSHIEPGTLMFCVRSNFILLLKTVNIMIALSYVFEMSGRCSTIHAVDGGKLSCWPFVARVSVHSLRRQRIKFYDHWCGLMPRNYAGPTSLEKDGNVLLRPWHLPWESQCGLKGMCEFDFWMCIKYMLIQFTVIEFEQKRYWIPASTLRKWSANLDSWSAWMVSWRIHQNPEQNGWLSQNHDWSSGWFRRLGVILLKLNLQMAQRCSKLMVSCIARVGHVHWCSFWCYTWLSRIQPFGRPSELNLWIIVLRAELLLKCELISRKTQWIFVWTFGFERRRLARASLDNCRCFVKSRMDKVI